jgi:hypothetical protein
MVKGVLKTCWAVSLLPGMSTVSRIEPITPNRLPTSRTIPLQRYNVPDDMVKNLLAGHACMC